MMATTCTICGSRNTLKSEDDRQTDGGVIKSLLKLMKIVDLEEPTLQEISNSGWDPCRLFCTFCNSRNAELHTLFVQLDHLNNSIENIKIKIQNDITTTTTKTVCEEIDHLASEPESSVENTLRLVSANLRRLIVENLHLTKSKNISTQTDEEVQQSNPKTLRPRLKSKIKVDSLLDDSADEGSFSPPTIDEVETDSDFSIDKIVKKCKVKRTRKHAKSKSPVDAPKKTPTNFKKDEQTTTTTSSTTSTTTKLRRQFNNLKDVVVQVEKLPIDYLTKFRSSEDDLPITRSNRAKSKIKRFGVSEDDVDLKQLRLSCLYDTCKRTFKTEEEKSSHIKKKHEGITHPFSCTECHRKFRQQKIYEVHVKSHSGELPFVCTICGKGYCNRGALKSHAVRHTTDTPFKCELCPSAYKGYGGLVYHKRKVHSGEHPYICEVCGAQFVKSDKLKRHKASVHATDKPIICEVCGKGFSIQNYLYMHMRIHQGNPFGNKNRKKSVIASSSTIATQGQQTTTSPVINSVDDASEVEIVQLQRKTITVETLDSTLDSNRSTLEVSPQVEEEQEHYPQISTISHGSQQRQIILTLDTKSSNMTHHRLQTENPISNSTLVINFNKKALSAKYNSNKFENSRTSFGNLTYTSNDSVSQVVHEPQNLLLSTGGREGNVIITANSVSGTNNSPVPPSSIQQTFHFPPLAAISNIQQGVIQYFPLSSIPEQFPNGFEFFTNQSNTNT